MRILLLAIIIFLVIHSVRVDFVEGTIPQKATPEITAQCEHETLFISVTSLEGDTIESLFAMYPDHNLTFIDRLEQFYSLNPQLKLQAIVGGDKILLPLSNSNEEDCL